MSTAPTPSSSQSSGQELGVVFPMDSYRQKDLIWLIPFVAASASRVAPYVSDLDPRNILPEPFDIPDHVGNAAVTFVLLSQVANGYWGKNPEALSTDEYENKRRNFAIAVGGLTVAANAFAETVGYGKTSTPDKLDFIYGLIGGLMAYKAKKPYFDSPERVDRILKEVDPDHPYRKSIEEALMRKQLRENKNTPIIRKGPLDPNPNTGPKRNRNKTKMQKKSRQQNRRKR